MYPPPTLWAVLPSLPAPARAPPGWARKTHRASLMRPHQLTHGLHRRKEAGILAQLGQAPRAALLLLGGLPLQAGRRRVDGASSSRGRRLRGTGAHPSSAPHAPARGGERHFGLGALEGARKRLCVRPERREACSVVLWSRREEAGEMIGEGPLPLLLIDCLSSHISHFSASAPKRNALHPLHEATH